MEQELKQINERLNEFTTMGYEVKITNPYVSITDAEGRRWNGSVDTLSVLLDEILHSENCRKQPKRGKKNPKQ